jgi:aminoglycoside phosphotransferase (APT) family kinase protein
VVLRKQTLGATERLDNISIPCVRTAEEAAVTMVELEALRDRISTLVAEWRGARVDELRPLLGGRSSLTYFVSLEDGWPEPSPIVVKMAPPGLPPTRNRDVLRQARVQDAVFESGLVPVARVLFADHGEPPDDPPLYAMEFIEGESFEPVLDPCEELPAPAVLRERQLSAARILGRLHSLVPVDAGLQDEPEVTLVNEVARWARIFETVSDDLRPGYEACADALLAAAPPPVPSTVVHGEYRLGNMLACDATILAVIDWELWCREDPRVDLSWFLQYVDAAEQPSAVRPTPPGMPSRAELLAAYEDELGRKAADLPWFEAHARFKMAAITAITSKHNRRREQPDPEQEARVPLIVELIEQARGLLSAS